MDRLISLRRIILGARQRFTELLTAHARRGVTVEMYQRYLSMQYHLTRNVQWYFFVAAAHHDLARTRALRGFLCRFANEEELHYVVAGNDLREMQLPILPAPLDVELWHAYFREDVQRRPFVRLGAACILENMAGPENRELLKELLKAPFLNAANTKFLRLHMHEQLPHGEQILSALEHEDLNPAQLANLAEGARKGAVMYLRMAAWAVDSTSLASLADVEGVAHLPDADIKRIADFDMAELGPDRRVIGDLAGQP